MSTAYEQAHSNLIRRIVRACNVDTYDREGLAAEEQILLETTASVLRNKVGSYCDHTDRRESVTGQPYCRSCNQFLKKS